MPKEFTTDQVNATGPCLRSALSHLIQCWDALREAEKALNCEIEMNDLEDIATGCVNDTPIFTNEQVGKWLKEIGKEPDHG